MIDTCEYDSPDLDYDFAVYYDGAMITDSIPSEEAFGIPKIIQGTPGVVGRRRRRGGRAYDEIKDREEYERWRHPFISVAIQASILSVNDENIQVSASDFRFAGEDKAPKVDIQGVKVETVTPEVYAMSDLVPAIPDKTFISSALLEDEEEYESEIYEEEEFYASASNPFGDGISVEAHFVNENQMSISAAIITNTNDSFIINTEIVSQSTI